ncbi:MAG TPA: M90 family metallopeptidase [Dokdonella sp.]|uniref:M90 family metallopeptidase n=1 Tax=Dokdonella sp. TaxID=2291710 RepID=UPI002B919E8C|nr:M90 family metallopeptidase [Dokdonella sp.]HUD41868.1 M90 family metallopeptidase [Dokdonella sp.]
MIGWLSRLRETIQPPDRIGDEDWHRLLASSALFGTLESGRLHALRALTERFLAHKRFSAAAGHVLDDAQCLAIAALAALPVLNLGFDALSGWREVIVYPGEFRVRREYHDEDSGVVTEGEETLIGEAWERGPLIVSWADVAADLERPFDGFNVVVHEIAHKLDLLDGAMNGVPALPASLPRREWIATMQAAYDDLLSMLDAGEEPAIDPYAGESAEEFFAVVSELHFSDPALLGDALPAVADLLRRYYG